MRTRTICLRSLTALAAMAELVLGGCDGHRTAANGPLNSSSPISLGSNCAPGGRPVAFGSSQFTNHGHTTVTLDRVVLLHPHNAHLVGSYAVPGDRVVGVMYWPVRNPPTQPAWKDRQPVHGFRLVPRKSFNMVLGIAAIAAGSRAISQGMLVYYHDSSGSYVATDHSTDIIAAKTHSCA